MQKQDIKIITRIDDHDRDVNILESNLTVTKNNLTKISDDVIDHAEANKKNLKVLDEKINSKAGDITETLANEMKIHRANFTKTINRVEKQSLTYFTNLTAKVDAQSAISQGRSSIN